jgi:tetratricopeptide (TPR) repeat protein
VVGPATLALPQSDVPELDEMDAWLETDPGDWSDRLARSFVHEAAGDLNAALQDVVGAPDSVWDDEGKSIWAHSRVYSLLEQSPSLIPLVRVWVDERPEMIHPVGMLMQVAMRELVAREQHLRDDVDARFDYEPFGVPAWWFVTSVVDPNEYVAQIADDVRWSDRSLQAAMQDVPALGVERHLTTGPGVFVGPDAPGAGLAEAFFEGGGEYLITIRSDAGFDVLVDGVPVGGRMGWQQNSSQRRLVRVPLRDGVHSIRIVIRQENGPTQVAVRVLPWAGAPVAQWLEAPAEELAGLVGSPSRMSSVRDLVAPIGVTSRLAAMAASDLLPLYASGETCRLVFSSLAGDDHPVSALPMLRASACMSEVPASMAEDLAMSELRARVDLWEEAAGLQRELAERLMNLGQLEEARERAESARRTRPEPVQLRTLAGIYGDMGWYELAEGVWEEAAAADYYDCIAPERLLALRGSRGIAPDPSTMPASWLSCPSIRGEVAENWHLPRGETEEALETARRTYERDPLRALGYADLLMASDRMDDAVAVIENGGLYGLRNAEWFLADLSAVNGIDATTTLSESLSGADLRRRLAVSTLQGEDVLQALRTDGLEVVEEYLDSGMQPGGSVALVHDYMGTRFFEDGTVLSVVHTIQQVLTRDALYSEGEVGIPPGAVLLNVRTIKSDGRFYVPEEIAQKDAISMPNLEIGDFIEVEYAMEYAAEPGLSPTLLGDRFYFRIPSGPMFRSVMRYQYPSDWASRVQFDLRAFDGRREDSELGDTLITSFIAERVQPLVLEMLAPNPDETTPSVRAGWGRTWERSARYYSNYVLSTLGDSEILQNAIGMLRDEIEGEEPAALMRAMFRYVTDDIRGLTMFFSEPAVWTLASGEGDRTALLYAMLVYAGFEPDLVFIRTADMDQTETELVDDTVFDLVAIRVQDGRNTYWMEPDWDYYPFNYLRPEAQGAPGFIAVGPGAGDNLRTPVWDDVENAQNTTMEISLADDGSALVSAEIRVSLADSVGFREAVQGMASPAELNQRLEAYLGRTLPGLRLSDLDMPNLDDPDSPLRVVFEAEVPAMAQRRQGDAGGLILESRLGEMDLQSIFVGGATRVNPIRLSARLTHHATITIHAPDGMVFDVEPVAWDAEFAGIAVHRHLRSSGSDVVVIERSLQLRPFDLPAESYPDLAAFAAESESGARLRIPMVPR